MITTALNQKYVIEEQDSSLIVTISSKKNWFFILFMSMWLVAWVFGEIVTAVALLHGGLPLGTFLFALVWLSLWTIGGGYFLFLLLWQLVGKEVIEFGPYSISVQHQVLKFSPSKEYMLGDIYHLHVSPMTYNWRSWSAAEYFAGFSGGCIAFDYGAKQIHIGFGLDEAEAAQILKEIGARLPQYGI